MNLFQPPEGRLFDSPPLKGHPNPSPIWEGGYGR